jgi:hypothetical protein
MSESSYIPLPPETISRRLLGVVQAWLPVLTVVVGALWGLYTYLAHEREVAQSNTSQERRATRNVEARKPFLEKQLALYFEAAQVLGKMVTITPDAGEWPGVERRFWELYWSELAMVEDKTVEAAMVEFSRHLFDYNANYKTVASHNPAELENLKRPLYGASLEVAHAMRASITKEWGAAYTEPLDK